MNPMFQQQRMMQQQQQQQQGGMIQHPVVSSMNHHHQMHMGGHMPMMGGMQMHMGGAGMMGRASGPQQQQPQQQQQHAIGIGQMPPMGIGMGGMMGQHHQLQPQQQQPQLQQQQQSPPISVMGGGSMMSRMMGGGGVGISFDRSRANQGAEHGDPNNPATLLPNGCTTFFQNQLSKHLLRIKANGDVDFSARQMDHQDAMLLIIKASDGKHFRIGSKHHSSHWLRILPDGTIDGNGTIDSPYGEFEMFCPRPYEFGFISCYTGFVLASTGENPNLPVTSGITDISQPSSHFKFIMPPSAGSETCEYIQSNLSLLIKTLLSGSSSMSASMTMPDISITGPKVELDSNGRIIGVTQGSMEIHSHGSISVSSSSSIDISTSGSVEVYSGTGGKCPGYISNACVSKDVTNSTGSQTSNAPQTDASGFQSPGYSYQKGAPPGYGPPQK